MSVTYPGGEGPGKGKHIVLLSGDEEYRSEESMPMLGRLLAERLGFTCTAVFSIDPKTGEINPGTTNNMPGIEAVAKADLVMVNLRFRNLPDEQMAHFDAYMQSGKPIVGLRTATHAFNIPRDRKYHRYSFNAKSDSGWEKGWGRQVLGETWVNHHGHHKHESTRGLLAPEAKDHPILRGLKDGDVWGDTDVYTVNLPLPGDSKPLVLGQVMKRTGPHDPKDLHFGMRPTDDQAVEGKKNNPMMPVAWTKTFSIAEGKSARVFTTTMGSSSDFVSAGTRRLVVNGVLWALGMEDQIKPDLNVDPVGEFKPSAYGFGAHRKGVKPADLAPTASAPAAAAPLPAAIAAVALAANPQPFKLAKGDTICIIGNTLAERMQHDGWLEALIQSRHPGMELTFRDLGYSGDEITLRLRSQNFGSPDEWLAAKANPIGGFNHNRLAKAHSGADVIFAFFGYGESAAGAAGLDKFKSDLSGWIDNTLKQKYNGESAPRIVLFSPTAIENTGNPDHAAPGPINERLALYTKAMAEVAGNKGVTFVDLFTPTSSAFASSGGVMSINGLHLTAKGNEFVARAAVESLLGKGSDGDHLPAVLAAVKDKNWHWFNRYRVTDQFSTYGSRGFLTFHASKEKHINKNVPLDPKGMLPKNYEVLQRELEILDTMTANRDRAIWAVAAGQSNVKPDDSNLPAHIPAGTNKPGPGPNGEHVFLDGEEAISKMTVAKDMKVTLFASEKQFPELVNPVQMAFDTRGRLWVCAWRTYPHWKPGEPMNDKLLILEDTNGDGVADKCTTFAGDIHNPTGFEFGQGGVFVAQGPDLLFLKDTNGDDKYDVRERVIHGLDTADTHHTANSFTYCPGGALYFQEGTFHHTQVETPFSPNQRVANGAVFRYEPRTSRFDVYVSYGFANPHGHVFDRWGTDVVVDGTGSVPYFGPTFSGKTYFPQKRAGGAPTVYKQRTRPATSPIATVTPSWSATSSASRASSSTSSNPTAPASWARRSSPSSSPATPASDPWTWRSHPTDRSTSPTGRTRSSATCSTTSATSAATRPTAASTA